MREQFNYGDSDQAWTYAKTKKLIFFAMTGFESMTSGLSLRPKSSNEHGEVRTRDLAHAADERNHQTKRLTSANRVRTRGLRSSYANIFFPGSRPGCDWPFFRSYRRSAILFIFARSFFTQEEFDPLWLFLFGSGHENEPLGLRGFHKRNPQKIILSRLSRARGTLRT